MEPPTTTTTTTTRIELPARTIAKVVLTLAILWLAGRLWTVLLLVFIALLIAAALDPIVGRLERRRWPRPASVALIVAVVVAALGGVGWLLVAPVIVQGRQLATDLPGYVERAQALVDANPDLFERARTAAERTAADPAILLSGLLRVGVGVASVASTALIVAVLTVYLLVDGERVIDWVLHYAPLRQRAKVRRAMPEISKVVSGYVVGQAITSTLFGLVAFATLSLVGVPQPLLLALLAGLLDAVPIAGILVATVPAVLLALTVSWPAAAIVLAVYVGYQQVENYLLVPRVYRDTLRISSFAVLIAVLVGAELLGIVGVLLALPVAAAVPVVERAWREE